MEGVLKNPLPLKVFFLLLSFFFLVSCFYFVSPFRKVERALKRGDCQQARELFMLVERKKLFLAEKSAQVCRTRSVKEAVWFYEYLMERVEELEKRKKIQKTLAEIYFEQLKDYEKAIEMYSFLREGKEKKKSEKEFYSFRIALSYFEMGKWTMSLKEVNSLIAQEKKEHKAPPASHPKALSLADQMFLKARILLMQKQYSLAEQAFREIQKTAPAYFQENQLFFYLSFIYEFQKDFHQAISELENFQSASEFFQDKIKRLKKRQSNQPGRSL